MAPGPGVSTDQAAAAKTTKNRGGKPRPSAPLALPAGIWDTSDGTCRRVLRSIHGSALAATNALLSPSMPSAVSSPFVCSLPIRRRPTRTVARPRARARRAGRPVQRLAPVPVHAVAGSTARQRAWEQEASRRNLGVDGVAGEVERMFRKRALLNTGLRAQALAWT